MIVNLLELPNVAIKKLDTHFGGGSDNHQIFSVLFSIIIQKINSHRLHKHAEG